MLHYPIGGVNLPCHLVIIKGTEYFDGKQCKYVDMPVTDVLQMMGRAGRPQFDQTGTVCIFVHEPKKIFYKKFLHEPFPVESSLHLQLSGYLNAEIATGAIHNVRDCIEYLTWTYYFRRLVMNPTYYGLYSNSSVGSSTIIDSDNCITSGNNSSTSSSDSSGSSELSAEVIERHLVELIATVASDLHAAGCIEFDNSSDASGDSSSASATTPAVDTTTTTSTATTTPTPTLALSPSTAIATNTSFSCTYLGRIASLYYLHYKTPGQVRAGLFQIDNTDFNNYHTYYNTNIHTNKQRINKQIKEINQITDINIQYWSLLVLISNCLEFSEIPVRHNEEHLNEQLCIDITTTIYQQKLTNSNSFFSFIIKNYEFTSAHCKTMLLLVSHLENMKLPISDYNTDRKTILDQIIRVMKAVIEIAVVEGLYDIVIRLFFLLQSLIQVSNSFFLFYYLYILYTVYYIILYIVLFI